VVDERGYCTDCDSSDCLHAQIHDALAQVEFWKRKATERVVEPRRIQSDTATEPKRGD
jgi:hypothetical protein